ncbi:MAG: NAD(P)-binding protein, partial [Alphaproteobacteria bacterium]|nr:NAD(P)-binding protein [Alphaproteobacteria bacterium]
MGGRDSKKILIVGAGIGGLTAALALSKFNMDCVVFEQSPSLDDIGAGIQLSPNAMCVFAALGVDKDILRLAVEPDTCHLRDFRTGRLELSLPFKGVFEKRYGAKYLHIHRA